MIIPCSPGLISAPTWSWSMDGSAAGWNLICIEREKLPLKIRRLALLNAVVPHSAFVYMEKISLDEAKVFVEAAKNSGKPILSFIGHPATAVLLTELLGIEVPVNRGMYKPEPSKENRETLYIEHDVALVFRLKKRLSKPEDVKNVTPDDLEIWVVWYT